MSRRECGDPPPPRIFPAVLARMEREEEAARKRKAEEKEAMEKEIADAIREYIESST